MKLNFEQMKKVAKDYHVAQSILNALHKMQQNPKVVFFRVSTVKKTYQLTDEQTKAIFHALLVSDKIIPIYKVTNHGKSLLYLSKPDIPEDELKTGQIDTLYTLDSAKHEVHGYANSQDIKKIKQDY